jgi:hypothetical protein
VLSCGRNTLSHGTFVWSVPVLAGFAIPAAPPSGFLIVRSGGCPMRSLLVVAMSIVAGFILFGIVLVLLAVTR